MKIKLKNMKNTILSAFFVLALVVNGFTADKNNVTSKAKTEASYFAQNNFNARFRGAKDVVWSNVDGYYKASFTLNDIKKAAFFDAQGEYVATTQYVSAESLPAATLSKLNKLYKGYTIGEVLQFEVDEPTDISYYTTSETGSNTKYFFASLRKAANQIVVKISSDSEITYFKTL